MTDPEDERRGAITPLRAALSNLCVNCGQSPLDRSYLNPVDRCPVCGADYRRHAAGDGAVFIVLTALCFVVMGAVVTLEFAIRPPIWAHAVLALGLSTGLALALLPPAKRFMVAQSFAMDARGEGLVDGQGSGDEAWRDGAKKDDETS